MFTVVLIEPPNPYVRAQLEGRVEIRVVKEDQSDLHQSLATADALFVRLFPVSRDIISRAPRLKVIGRHGVGYDTVDIAAATERGIPVVYTPAANSDAVAEHAVLLMLAVARRLVALDRSVRSGAWQREAEALELRGRTVGIVGLGQIGRRVAHLCGAGLGMTVLGYDPLLSEEQFPPRVTRMDQLADLLGSADIVTLHTPLSEATRHLIDKQRLEQMKPGAILINTARGKLVDEVALHQALISGRLVGAGLDVLEDEPPATDNPLLATDTRLVTLTPHVAGLSDVSRRRMADLVCSGLLAVLQGQRPPNVVNPEVWASAADRTKINPQAGFE